MVLLPSNQNRLLMQWKCLYKVETVVEQNNYRVLVNRKSKTYHANLLKLCIDRVQASKSPVGLSRVTGGTVLEAVSGAICDFESDREGAGEC